MILSGSLGMVAAVMALAQGNAGDLLAKHTKALTEAQSLSVRCTVQRLGGAPEEIRMVLARPNKAYIEDSKQVIVADGTTITTLDKKSNSYYKRNQAEGDLVSLLNREGISTWAAFFNANQFAKIGSPKAAGTKNRKGVEYRVVTITAPDNSTTWTLYLSAADGIARQSEIAIKSGKDQGTILVDAKEFALGEAPGDVFVFKAPSNAKEVSEAEMFGDRWYTDLDEAMQVAAKTGRLILLDFYTDWCHWCKELDAKVYPEEDFKKMSKYFVFCKVDAEKGKGVAWAQKYGVSGYPTIKFLRSDGTVVHEIVGYMPLGPFLAEMQKAVDKG
jgi:thioredoxin-related protein